MTGGHRLLIDPFFTGQPGRLHHGGAGLLHQDAQAWRRRVEAETDTRVAVLKPGESFEF